MNNKNFGYERTGITTYQTKNKFIATIPPIYTWRKHSATFYFFLINYIVFVFLNITLIRSFIGDTNFALVLYCICFLLAYILENEISYIINDIQLVMLALFSYVCFKNGNNIFFVTSTILLTENLFFAEIRNKLLRDIFETTKIEVSKDNFTIIKINIIFSRLVFFTDKGNFDISLNTRINLYSLLDRIKSIWIRSGKNPYRRAKRIAILEENQYFFGAFLNKQEKEILFQEIKMYKKSVSANK